MTKIRFPRTPVCEPITKSTPFVTKGENGQFRLLHTIVKHFKGCVPKDQRWRLITETPVWNNTIADDIDPKAKYVILTWYVGDWEFGNFDRESTKTLRDCVIFCHRDLQLEFQIDRGFPVLYLDRTIRKI